MKYNLLKQIVLSVVFLLCCHDASSVNIGDIIEHEDGSKGMVFYVNNDGNSGWEVSLNSLGNLAWGELGSNVGLFDNSLANINGYEETVAILKERDNGYSFPAAEACDIRNGWHLPSFGQLKKLMALSPILNPKIIEAGGTEIFSPWCTSEFGNGSYAWCITAGQPVYEKKDEPNEVRPIRTFSCEDEQVVYDSTVSYIWNTGEVTPYIDVTPSSTSEFSLKILTEFGCETTAKKKVVVINGDDQIVYDTICAGEKYTNFGFDLSESGTYTKELSVNDCRTTLTLVLEVLPEYKVELNDETCQYSHYNENGFYLYPMETGLVSDTMAFLSSTGCDSIVILNLKVNPATYDTIYKRICQTEGYEDGDFSLSSNQKIGINYYSIEKTNEYGCKMYHTLKLQVDEAYHISKIDSVCMGAPYNKFGFNIDGELTDTIREHELRLKSTSGCDSIVRLRLNIIEPYSHIDTFNICNGDSVIWRNLILRENGFYSDTLICENGCDSIMSAFLIVNPNYKYYDTLSVCSNDSVEWRGYVLKEEGTYVDSLLTENGCDSLFYMTVIPIAIYKDSIFENLTSGLIFDKYGVNFRISSDTIVKVKYLSSQGCDSILYVDIRVTPVDTVIINDFICEDHIYVFNDSVYNKGGQYIQYIDSETGNDSLVVLNLITVPRKEVRLDTVLCSNDVFLWYGVSYREDISFVDTLQTSTGCDSVVHITIRRNEPDMQVLYDTICESYQYEWYGKVLSASGTYFDTLTSNIGCDSIVGLFLTVNRNYSDTIKRFICDNENPNIQNHSLVIDSLQSFSGCDSVVVTEFMILPTYADTTFISLEHGNSTVFEGSMYNSTGWFSKSLKSVSGCDSVRNLRLSFYTEFNDSICENSLYDMHGFSVMEQGSYRQEYLSSDGVDSVVVLNLTVLGTPSVILQDTICAGTVFDNGEIHIRTEQVDATQDISKNFLIENRNGCDSSITLNLHIKANTRESIKIDICEGDGYDFFDSTLTTTGEYIRLTEDENNCISKVVYLSVHPEPNLLDLIPVNGGYKIIYTKNNENEYYEFSIDGLSVSDFFTEKLNAGNHKVLMSSDFGCSSEIEIKINERILPMPYFTPNGDCENDIWQIANIDQFPNSKVQIFTRWGKLIATYYHYDNNRIGWDGSYLGEPMPSTDYWYVIEADKTYTGHFTLIRQ